MRRQCYRVPLHVCVIVLRFPHGRVSREVTGETNVEGKASKVQGRASHASATSNNLALRREQ